MLQDFWYPRLPCSQLYRAKRRAIKGGDCNGMKEAKTASHDKLWTKQLHVPSLPPTHMIVSGGISDELSHTEGYSYRRLVSSRHRSAVPPVTSQAKGLELPVAPIARHLRAPTAAAMSCHLCLQEDPPARVTLCLLSTRVADQVVAVQVG